VTITEDGVWRIRRKERSPIIEVFRIEETGHGDILSDEFINWRIKLALSAKQSVELGDSASMGMHNESQ
jgi:RAT1-interacting protein